MSAESTRTFVASPAIIYSLIKAQAGTLAKGFLEAIQNSEDAGATEIAFEVTPEGFEIKDNGQGFTSKEQIIEVFEVFGWEHEEGSRKFGRFGIGRAQLWNFARTVWRSHGFVMDVDIKNKGLDYVLKSGQSPEVKGLTIEGTFYSPFGSTDLFETQKELADLCKYTDIRVTYNGKRLNKDCSQEKWTHDLPEMYVLLNNRSSMAVYNQGVLVRSYPAFQMGGMGGVVCTKSGFNFMVNMARNDILQTDCPLWRKLRPLIKSLGEQQVKKKRGRKTEDEYKAEALALLSSGIGLREGMELKVVEVVPGKSISFNALKRSLASASLFTFCVEPNAGLESACRQGEAVAITANTLNRFEVGSLQEFVELSSESGWLDFKRMPHLKVTENFMDALSLREGFALLTDADLNSRQRLVMSALSSASHAVFNRMGNRDLTGYFVSEYIPEIGRNAMILRGLRDLRAGSSDGAHAWTDGKTFIALNVKVLNTASRGLFGFLQAINVIVHEYLHSEDNRGSNVHDHEFYNAFHDLICIGQDSEFLIQVGMSAYRYYLRRLNELGLPVSKVAIQEIDLLETVADESPLLDLPYQEMKKELRKRN